MLAQPKPEKMFCLAGFAIEDSVRLRIVFESSGTDPEPIAFVNNEASVFDKAIPLTPQNRSAQIEKAMMGLLALARESVRLEDIDVMAVVSVGTIEHQHKLIGIATSLPNSKWHEDGAQTVSVDFLDVVNRYLAGQEVAKQFVVGKNFIASTDAKASAAAISLLQDFGDDFVYLPVGMGVNAGIMIYGQPVIRDQHPEIGHFYPPPHQVDAQVKFPGTCGHHGSCLEGYLSIPAMLERKKYISEWQDLSEAQIRGSATWNSIAAHYLAHLLYMVTLAFSPKKIVISPELVTNGIREFAVNHLENLRQKYPNFQTIMQDDYVVLARNAKADDEMRGALSLAWLIATESPHFPRQVGDLMSPIKADSKASARSRSTNPPAPSQTSYTGNVIDMGSFAARKLATQLIETSN